MLNEKGFIGSIGDDLPSLIPLLLALVIFFSTFTFSFNTFDQRNEDFEDDLAVLNIARVLQSDGYISGLKEFRGLCNTLTVPNLKFVAGLSPIATAPEHELERYKDVEDAKVMDAFFVDFDGELKTEDFFDEDDSDWLMCTNIQEAEFEDKIELAKKRSIITRIFPVVLEQERIVRPVHLVVMAWK